MTSKKESRRQFIKQSSALLAAATGGLTHSLARAQNTSGANLRLLTLIDPFGLPTEQRRMTITTQTADQVAINSNQLGTTLQPLRNYVDNMLIVSNMNLESRNVTSTPNGSHHHVCAHVLSGSRRIEAANNSSATLAHASIDVAIANHMQAEGLSGNRLFSHLYFSDAARRTGGTYCFDKAGIQIRSIAGVNAAIQTVFGNTDNNNALQNSEGAIQAKILREISTNVQTLKNRINRTNTSNKLDAYNTSVTELADTLELQASANENDGACSAPINLGAPGELGRDAIFKVIAQLFACDMATSVTYAIGDESLNLQSYPFLDINESNELTRSLGVQLHGISHRTDDVSDKVMELVRTYYMEKTAELVQTLANTPDIDGQSSVLDNTVIFWAGAMGKNIHNTNDQPYLIIAGDNTNLKGGFHYDCDGRTNNDLYTTIAQGLNIPFAEFGGYNAKNKVNKLNNGPISKMLKRTIIT